MNSRTRKLIVELHARDWFANVGTPIDNPHVFQVHSWKAALAHSDSEDWDTLLVVRYGDIAAQAFEADYRHHRSEEKLEKAKRRMYAMVKGDRNNMWDKAVDEIEPVVNVVVDEKVAGMAVKNKFPTSFCEIVQFSILSGCLEEEFRDRIEESFFMQLILLYLQGHYPCGWDGEYPSGRLIVF